MRKTMENTFRELKSLLLDGPAPSKEDIFHKILEIILSCTVQEEAKEYFTAEFLKTIFTYRHANNSLYSGIIYNIFINIFSIEDLNQRLSLNNEFMAQIIFWTLDDISTHSNRPRDAESGCKLLSNVTRIPKNCEIILNLDDLPSRFSNLVSAFTSIKDNTSECSLDHLAMVLCNLSQLTEIRKIISDTELSILPKLVPFMGHESLIRRRGIVGVVHNCAFDSAKHQWMLGDEVDILPHLLLPLAGPEQFDDEDNDKLPFDLQFLPDTKRRESDPEIRKHLLETLNQLCATRFGREYLREKNAYIILRELHKCEEDPSVLLSCENVVDILIRTEDEIGIDHLKSISVPQDLEDKFSNLMKNSI